MEEEEEEEFSFSCTNPDWSPRSADDVSVNSQIRPIFPIFNRYVLFGGSYDGDLRPKLLIEKRDRPSSSVELCKKSNSIGFSKLWRFRDLVHQSNNDGKERVLALCGTVSRTVPTHLILDLPNTEIEEDLTESTGMVPAKDLLKVKSEESSKNAREYELYRNCAYLILEGL
nr:uncharacterized protein LOC111986871 [Quercus suber]